MGKKRNHVRRGWIFFLVVGILGSFLWGSGKERAFASDAKAEVTYMVKNFQDGKARFYDYKAADGITIKYFIIKGSDGIIRAAFDACDVCWPEGKGYRQKGDYMICQNCGKRFASLRVGDVQGGCNPAPLKREVGGDKLVIKVKDLLEGKKYFNFAKKG